MRGPQLCPCRRFALSSALARKCCISQATYVPTRLQPSHSLAAVSNTCGWIFVCDARRVLLEIGRASCRERVWTSVDDGGVDTGRRIDDVRTDDIYGCAATRRWSEFVPVD